MSNVPARLHAILARKADNAVVFRRGPSDQVAVIGWNLKNDTFTPGQWFRGRIYEYRCDLTPDGRYLVYFAAKYGRTNPVEERLKTLIAGEIGECPDQTWEELLTFLKLTQDFNWDDPASFPQSELPQAQYYREYKSVRTKLLRKYQKEFRKMRSSPDYRDASWTGISRTPYLKTLDLWWNGSGWNGGGLFIDNSQVWINRPAPHRGTHIPAQRSGLFKELSVPLEDWWGQGGECPGIYFPRIERDGWIYQTREAENFLYEKPLSNNLTLRKIFHCGPGDTPGQGVYREQHAVWADGKPLLDGSDWRWADYDAARNRILFAKAGVVYALKLDDPSGNPVLLCDFNNMKFKRLSAPY